MFEVVIEYDASNQSIEKNFTVTDTISSPVYLYYRLSSFFINHRRFLTSRDEDQLAGDTISQSALETCDPRIDDGQNVNSTNPCGLAAAAFFSDNFTLYYGNKTVNGTTLGINPQYEKKLYKCPDGNCSTNRSNTSDPSVNPTNLSINLTDPHFITWMRPQPFSSFSKKYLVFEDGLIPGFYILRINEDPNKKEDSTVNCLIENFFFSNLFFFLFYFKMLYKYLAYEPSSHGKKYVVLATSSWLGKRTLFPGLEI